MVILFLLTFSYIDVAIIAWQVGLLGTLLLIAVYVFLSQYMAVRTSANVLTIDGQNYDVCFKDRHYLLERTSRIAFYGCYLVVSDQSELGFSIQSRTIASRILERIGSIYRHRLIFVDRRQLTPKQFSTLCFIIRKAQFSQGITA